MSENSTRFSVKGGVSSVKFPGNFVYESNESTRRIKNYLREKQSTAKKLP